MEARLILLKGLNEARWRFALLEAGKHQSDDGALGRSVNSRHMSAVAQRSIEAAQQAGASIRPIFAAINWQWVFLLWLLFFNWEIIAFCL